MPQSLSKIYLHIVFGTKYRQALIRPELENDLYPYIGGIIRKLDGHLIAIDGMPDHIHILSTLPRTISTAKFLEEIKRSSSKWIKTQGEMYKSFKWQGGYCALSVNSRGVERVRQYILNQKQHHRKFSFQEEVAEFLEEYQIVYNEKYLWD